MSLVAQGPDTVVLRVRAEPADEFTARVLGFAPRGASREDGTCGCTGGAGGEQAILYFPYCVAARGQAHVAEFERQEWREAIPGLYGRLVSAGNGTAVTVEFRPGPVRKAGS